MATSYEVLGVPESATQDEIKRAYRSLASKNHPDKGGDTAKFQEIQAAYAAIETPDKRAQYDAERQNPFSGTRFNMNGHEFNGHNMEDLFREFGFNFNGSPFGFRHQQPRRNKDIRIDIQVLLNSTLEEQSKTVSVQTTNGNRETVDVQIPRGVTHGTQIKYTGLGDNFFNTLPRGDLYVQFHVMPNPGFTVHGIDLHTTIEIDCLSAIVGGETEVTGIDGSKFMVVIPQGTQPNSMLRIRGQGVWELNGSTRGNLIVKIHVTVPRNLTEQQLDSIKQIQQTL
jgi:curved DNA-binding protein